MRPLRYSINVTLDGCCDHRVMIADEDVQRHAVENLERADGLLFGRVTYEMMEAGWRQPVPAGARPDWMDAFAQKIDAAKKYVVSTGDHTHLDEANMWPTAFALQELTGAEEARIAALVKKAVT